MYEAALKNMSWVRYFTLRYKTIVANPTTLSYKSSVARFQNKKYFSLM
jgi:hypothetical protein